MYTEGVYTSRGEDFLETGMGSRMVPLFEGYGVQMVSMGHNHGYGASAGDMASLISPPPVRAPGFTN